MDYENYNEVLTAITEQQKKAQINNETFSRVFFGIETAIAIASVILYAMLPNKEVDNKFNLSK